MELECYPTVDQPADIVPGRPQRGWMDRFTDRHPYRCLPLTMANTTGWELLCPVSFTAEWTGGIYQHDIILTPDKPFPYFEDFVRTHFSHGVLTFIPGYLFKTPPGWSMWAMGPPNHVKDGIQPLVGLIETDWLPFPFTMNWLFTRPGKVRFEKGESFCFMTLQKDKEVAEFQPVIRRFETHPELKAEYDAWFAKRDEFNARIFDRDPSAMKEAWQRFYFKGEMASGEAEGPMAHVNKRRLKAPKLGGG